MLDVIKGKYKIVREIARSNDIVYEAVDTNLGRRIALKELNAPPNLTGQGRRERIERFNREARAAGRLSHPNIVSVFDTGEENGRYFIAMEYLEGQTLRDMLAARGVLSLRDSVDITSQILDALAYAHTNRVIHRDIKPDNIFILPGGQIKLTDFGIARLTEEPALTSNGQVFGTPSYMSPEQIVGQGIDYRSDIFSVGVLLYEMLSGRKPFLGDSVVSITYAVMNAEPPPLSGVPGAIADVVRRALSKRPEQRFLTADQMRMELRNAEQTPTGLFGSSPMPTGMGTVYSAQPPYPSQMPGNPNIGGYPGMTNGYGAVSSGAYVPPSPPASPATNYGTQGTGNLPWQFSAPGGQSAGQPGSQPNGAVSQAANAPLPSPTGTSGFSPFASPPFPARPAEPFVLPPAVRSTLALIAIAALLGGGIAFGVTSFLKSYDRYHAEATRDRITTLMQQATDAYNKQDFASAAPLFEQALKASPDAAQRQTILTNLAYTYIQLGNASKATGDNARARAQYEKALIYAPDNPQAHRELAAVLSLLGDNSGAQREQAAIQTSAQTQDAPPNMQVHATTESADTAVFLKDKREKAAQLIAEGENLMRAGNMDEARVRWQKAVEEAPGTPERDQALQLLNQTPPPATNSDTNNGGE